jgi:hypothetical protein
MLVLHPLLILVILTSVTGLVVSLAATDGYLGFRLCIQLSRGTIKTRSSIAGITVP